MTNSPRTTRLAAALLGLALFLPASALAQRFGVAVGYVRMPGQIGAFHSNEGTALRLGADLNPRAIARIGFEAGVSRQNLDRRFGQAECFHPAGGIATCYSDYRERDTGWSLAAILRAGPRSGSAQPYGLVGLEAMSVRTRSQSVVTDSTGAHLANFEYNGTHSDGALALPLGAGLLIRPAGSPIGISVEGRVTSILHGYDGSPQISWSPSVVLGVRWGG